MSGLKGDISGVRKLERAIQAIPFRVGAKVAARSADVITELGQATFNAQQNAYGDAWPDGADGEVKTMRETGALAEGVRYVAIGTKLRARLGVPYARFLINKRPILPRNGAALPAPYVDALSKAASEVITAELEAVE